jgi:hypothetical protein
MGPEVGLQKGQLAFSSPLPVRKRGRDDNRYLSESRPIGSLHQARIYLPDHHEVFEDVNRQKMSSSITEEGIPPKKKPEAGPIMFGYEPSPSVPGGEALKAEEPQRDHEPALRDMSSIPEQVSLEA